MGHHGTMKRVHVIVRGGVQGVGYRWTARLTAGEVGVSGWIRNRADGSVEAEVEGDPARVDEMLAWMAEGPPGASVDGAEVTELPPAGGSTFDVLPTA